MNLDCFINDLNLNCDIDLLKKLLKVFEGNDKSFNLEQLEILKNIINKINCKTKEEKEILDKLNWKITVHWELIRNDKLYRELADI